MCGGHSESDGARSGECRYEGKGELASARSARSAHKQEGELNTRASLHANAKRESVTLSTSLYANVELGKSTTRGEVSRQGKETGTLRKEKHNKSVYGNEKSRHDGVVRHTNHHHFH